MVQNLLSSILQLSDTHMQCFFPLSDYDDSQISPSECGGQQLLWLRSQWKCQCCTETSPALVCSQSGGTNFMIMAIFVCFSQKFRRLNGNWWESVQSRENIFHCWLFFCMDLFWTYYNYLEHFIYPLFSGVIHYYTQVTGWVQYKKKQTWNRISNL